MTPFTDRADAGRQLAAALEDYRGRADTIVLALPRGGVPVAFEIASALSLPLDVFLVRKLGVPGHAELAMGAIAEAGVEVLNSALIREIGISPEHVRQVAARERLELDRRAARYREDQAPPIVRSRTVIFVDDGLATGSTMEAAIMAARQQQPAAIVVAVPVGPRETCDRLSHMVDAFVCLMVPDHFEAVGRWYLGFEQTSDDEVRRLLGEIRN